MFVRLTGLSFKTLIKMKTSNMYMNKESKLFLDLLSQAITYNL